MTIPAGGRAVIFGENAATYDETRPAYPKAVWDHVLARAEVVRAVEVGAGTGIATASFAAVGRKIICIEPSAEMAQLLEEKRLPDVEVVVADFETWTAGLEPVDLVYAAQAWHWIDPGIGYEKARGLLRPGGVLALMWNVPLNRYEGLESVYEQYAPEVLAEQDARIKKRDRSDWADDLGANGFSEVDRFVYPWTIDLSPSELAALYSTYSDHMLIPESRRRQLLRALEMAVEDVGGSVEVAYESRVFSGRK